MSNTVIVREMVVNSLWKLFLIYLRAEGLLNR